MDMHVRHTPKQDHWTSSLTWKNSETLNAYVHSPRSQVQAARKSHIKLNLSLALAYMVGGIVHLAGVLVLSNSILWP